MNALAHGMRSPAPVIPGEDAGEWERHQAGIVDALTPAGAVESALTDRVALLLWRMGRVARYETAMVGASVADAGRDYERGEEERQRYSDSHRYISTTPADCREAIRDATANARLLRGLDKRREGGRIAGVDAGLILHRAGQFAARRTDDGDFDADAVEYPGLPEGDDWDDLPHVTVATLRESLAVLATAAKTDAAGLIESVAYHYEGEARLVAARLEEVERELARMGARRMLLSAEDLDKVQRYEGHLHRQMIQTLRELEAMQERRRGGVRGAAVRVRVPRRPPAARSLSRHPYPHRPPRLRASVYVSRGVGTRETRRPYPALYPAFAWATTGGGRGDRGAGAKLPNEPRAGPGYLSKSSAMFGGTPRTSLPFPCPARETRVCGCR